MTDDHEPFIGPQPLPKPFVRRWDPIGALWVQCIVENGKAWDPKLGSYTPVTARELTPATPCSVCRRDHGLEIIHACE